MTLSGVTGNGTLSIALSGSHDIVDNFGILLSSTAPSLVNESYIVDNFTPPGPVISAPVAGQSVASPFLVEGSCSGAEGGTVTLTTSPA